MGYVASVDAERRRAYCVAWAARGRGIILHAISVESNHFHLIVTDPEGRLSEFMHELSRAAARCLMQHGQVIEDVETHIRDAQRQIAANMAAKGRSFAGVKAVLRTSPLDSPNTPRPRGKLNPALAAGGDREAMCAAANALELFRIAYREAWKRFKELGDAVFPAAPC